MMTREEREAMNELSLQVYGRKSYWQKLLKQGELVEERTVSANGNPMTIKRTKWLTVEDILARMEKVISDKKEAAAKAAEEAAKNTEGEVNGTEEKDQKEVSQASQAGEASESQGGSAEPS